MLHKNRVIQLGEDPCRVFQVGGLGIDNILKIQLLDRPALESALQFSLLRTNFLITFHPVTLETSTSAQQIDQLLAALLVLKDTGLIFTMPNADTDGRVIYQKINEFCAARKNAKAFTTLGQLRYLSCVLHFDGVIGNSSSGLLEVPSFRKATINIGDRQKGRLKAESVIDCEPYCDAILSAIQTSTSPDFAKRLHNVENPYGKGGASAAIVDKLESVSLHLIHKKTFYDLPLAK